MTPPSGTWARAVPVPAISVSATPTITTQSSRRIIPLPGLRGLDQSHPAHKSCPRFSPVTPNILHSTANRRGTPAQSEMKRARESEPRARVDAVRSSEGHVTTIDDGTHTAYHTNRASNHSGRACTRVHGTHTPKRSRPGP